ncbi:MAG: hypothetical protein K2Z81_12165 [Cyanobacteria bacterium]|nr:hypothetical protein [Cyanobacteriota bacterium]
MTFLIGRLEFEGPYHSREEMESRPGLFAILCETEDEYELLEIDHTETLNSCLDIEEYVSNLAFYQDNCNGALCAAIHYTDDLTYREREELKDELLGELTEEDALASSYPLC